MESKDWGKGNVPIQASDSDSVELMTPLTTLIFDFN